MLMLNDAGIIIDANMPLRSLFGWGDDELAGKPLAVLLPESSRAAHYKLVQAFFLSPYPRTMGNGRPLTGLHRDGREIPIEVGLSALPLGKGIAVVASIIDISEKMRWERQLQQASALASAIIHSAPFSIIATDQTGTIIAMSPAAEKMLGYGRRELVGKSTPELLHDTGEVVSRAAELSQELDETITPGFEVFVAKARRGMTEEREWTYRHKDGTLFPVSLTVTALRDQHNYIIGFLGIAYDISERVRSEKYMRHLAHHDGLTGLPNRLLLNDRIDREINSARRSGKNFALLMIDLDHFKHINDSLGHHIGDLLLIEVARRLCSCVRNTDTVARLGGDEFVVLLTDMFERNIAAAVSAKIVAEVSEQFQLEDQVLVISPSIGIAFYPHDGRDAETLLHNADVAMYSAKHEGRATARMYGTVP
jgi:diguanylate cyclase (GGDEF)-like protein/PAS domain S-box-containing protein